MSDVVGEIIIHVTNDSVNYESAFSIPEVLFWMEVLKKLILDKVTTPITEGEPV